MLPVAAASAAISLFGDQHPKDKGREETNRQAFNLANSTTGNRNAFMFLRQRSGKFGVLTIPPIPEMGFQGGPVGGWASGGDADEDAYAKYKSLATRYEALQAAGTGTALTGQVVDPTNADKPQDTPVLGQAQTAGFGGIMIIVAIVAAVLFTRMSPAEA